MKNYKLVILVTAVIVFVAAWGGWMVIFERHRIEKFGQLGDSFGVVNAVIQSLAMLGVAWSLLLQQQQQKGQEDEHKERMKLEKEVLQAHLAASNAQEKAAIALQRTAEQQVEILNAQIRVGKMLEQLNTNVVEQIRSTEKQNRIAAISGRIHAQSSLDEIYRSGMKDETNKVEGEKKHSYRVALRDLIDELSAELKREGEKK